MPTPLVSGCLRSWACLNHALRSIYKFCIALHAGFWLGLLDRQSLAELDNTFYQTELMYRDREYNNDGLTGWERRAIQRFFLECKSVLVAAAGGGREIIGLSRLGFETEGFECHPDLVTFGNELLTELDIGSRISQCQRDLCPQGSGIFDGALVGWGAYTLIQSTKTRVEFLRVLRNRVHSGGPILVSFYYRDVDSIDYKVTKNFANILRWTRSIEPIELGDSLAPNFVHYFSLSEIEEELAAGGFDVVHYDVSSYAHIVGVAV